MFLRYLSISAGILLLLVFLFLTLGEQQRDKRVNIVLLTVESLRADMVSQERTPKLMAAAANGYQFTNYRAVSAWTGTNIVSLLSGLGPATTGVHTRGQSIAKEHELPLKLLDQEGYGVVGLQPFMAMDIYQNLGLSLAQASPDPLLYIAMEKKAKRPFFLWYHYVHTHLPYAPSADKKLEEDLALRFVKAATQTAVHYNEADFTPEDVEMVRSLHAPGIAEFDRWFGSFWDFFIKGGFADDTILILTADHGDEYGERKMVGHASTTLMGHLHEEIVRLPFFIWLPERLRPKGHDPQRLSSHIDVMPTLLALLGKTDNLMQSGSSLFKRQEKGWSAMTSSGGFAEPDPAAIRYFEYSHIAGNWKSRLRLAAGDNPADQEILLYNLETDPGEQKNLAPSHGQIAAEHKAHLLFLHETKTTRPVSTTRMVKEFAQKGHGTAPSWVHPASSRLVSYKAHSGRLFLEWSGSRDANYILEYRAGHGIKEIAGSLEVEGNIKRFENITERFWNTWIIPASPFSLRVREEGGEWSPWLRLEARP